MSFSPRTQRKLSDMRRYIVIGAIAGIIYGSALGLISSGGQPLDGLLGALRGIFTGGLIAGLISGFEMLYARAPAGRAFRSQTFGRVVLIRMLIYSVIIFGSDLLGAMVVNLPESQPLDFNLSRLVTFAAGMFFAFIVNFISQISQLLGPGVLTSFMRGHYHKPRRENRLFLFVDMRGSTAIAERLGDIRFHNLLNLFVADVCEAIHEHGGKIHKYVGDEIIATWMLHTPGHVAGAFLAVRSAQQTLAAQAQSYMGTFGAVPAFRAVLHSGPIVAGEMGDIKREIALLGNTINTTAKIEQLMKSLPYDVVASRAALDAAGPLPAEISVSSLGDTPVPGRSEPIPLYSVTFSK